jgi:membrane-associated phospholipid phosphatase
MVARSDTVLYIEGHRKWYIGALVVSAVMFVWAAVAVHHFGIAGWEQRLMLSINHWPDRWRMVAVSLSTIGGSAWTAIITMVLSYIFKLYRLTWRLAVSFLIATAVVYVAKHLVSQPEVLHLVPTLYFRVATSGLAFPSGTLAIATVVSLSLLPYLTLSYRLALSAAVFVIGIARLYLGVQTPLDLVGGIALGVFLVSLIRVMPQNIRVFLRLD